MITMRATIHDRRIDVPAPDILPDGAGHIAVASIA